MKVIYQLASSSEGLNAVLYKVDFQGLRESFCVRKLIKYLDSGNSKLLGFKNTNKHTQRSPFPFFYLPITFSEVSDELKLIYLLK